MCTCKTSCFSSVILAPLCGFKGIFKDIVILALLLLAVSIPVALANLSEDPLTSHMNRLAPEVPLPP